MPSKTGAAIPSTGKGMQSDLDQPIGEIFRSNEALQRKILKVKSCATHPVGGAGGAGFPEHWRVLRRAHTKGSLRFLTAWTSQRTPSWREIKDVRPPNFGRSSSTIDGVNQKFQVTEARHLAGQDRDKPKYLAVSYRWQRAEDREKNEGFYDVRDPRAPGKVRKSRAPKSIINRAVAFATERRLRMVWIDQECINQSDREDKACGIRSMDEIFHNADKVVALLQEVSVDTFAEAEALRHLSRYEPLEPDLYKVAVHFLKRVSEDSWFERAWTLQEATSGGNTIELSMMCSPAFKQSDDVDDWGNVVNEIQFKWAHLAKWIAGLYAQAATYEQDPPPSLSSGELGELQQTVDNVRLSLMNHFPLVLEPIGLARPRLCCNAALGLAFLSDRKNSRAPDRVSMLASLGNYPIKLNTTKIKNRSMTVCVLAQALLNGDLSLLAGVEKDEWHGKRRPTGFSWLPPPTVALKDVLPYHEGFPSLRLSDHSLTEEGLLLQGYLWTVNTTVDVRSIRDKYAGRWMDTYGSEKLLPLIAVLRKIQRATGETEKKFHERLQSEAERFYLHGRDFQHLDDSYSTLTRHVLGSQILGELLSHLVRSGYLQLANSLWHSTRRRKPIWTHEEESELRTQAQSPLRTHFSSIWLERHHPLGEMPAALDGFVRDGELQIGCLSEPSRVSRLFVPMKDNWDWLIDRVMDSGVLWCGKSVATSSTAVNCCIFDVSSACSVLTPLFPGMEDMQDSGRLISHSLPKMRSKRISWVVESAPQGKGCGVFKPQKQSSWPAILPKRLSFMGDNSEEPRSPRLTTTGMVAGMWICKSIEPTRFLLT